MREYNSVDLSDINFDSYLSLTDENIILASGGSKHHNVMITNDVTFGVMGDKPIVTVYLDKDFYSRGYIEKKGKYSINLLDKNEDSAQIVENLTSGSGREFDKFDKAGLTLVMKKSTPTVAESKYVLVCDMMYRYRLKDVDFFDNYKKMAKDNTLYAYVAEITKAYEVIDVEGASIVYDPEDADDEDD